MANKIRYNVVEFSLMMIIAACVVYNGRKCDFGSHYVKNVFLMMAWKQIRYFYRSHVG